MPASLPTLPKELLLSIADYIESRSSVNSLTRTSRRLNRVINPYLYKQNATEGESSAMVWAAKYGQAGTMTKLIAQGGNVNARSTGFLKPKQSGFALLYTCEWVEDQLRKSKCTYCTPIYVAVLNGHEKVVELLLRNEVDLESHLGSWANPLQAAVESGRLLAARRLIAHKSAIEKPSPHNGQTALHIACRQGNDEIVRILIGACANTMARDKELETPLHLVLKGRAGSIWLYDRVLKTIQWLLIADADMHARNQSGQSPLSMAMRMKCPDAKRLFKEVCKNKVSEVYIARQCMGISTSLQDLWGIYLDKQTEAAAEALRMRRIRAEVRSEPLPKKKTAQKKLQVQRKRQAARRLSTNQKSNTEKREEMAEALLKIGRRPVNN